MKAIAFVIAGQFTRGKEIREHEHNFEIAMLILIGKRLGWSSTG